jgi:Putative Ig domain
VVGQPYSFTAHCSSGNQFPFAYTCTGDLPPGLQFTPGTPSASGPSSFTISGTPTQACAGNSYGVDITVTDSNSFPPFRTWHHVVFDFG